MRKILPLAFLALAVSAMPPARLDAWGFGGHKFIMDRAIDLLPQEIRPFFQRFRATLVERSIDPDTYRTVGWVEEPPRHFVDMDAYGAFPFKGLPHDYQQAVAKYGADFVIKNGTVPWRAQEIYDKLRDAFRQLPTSDFSRENIKLFSAVLSHYVADAFQPFHATLNYAGQLSGQPGILARFESELFDRYQDKLTVAPLGVTPVPNAREFIFATLTDSFTFVAPVLAADKQAVIGRTAYDEPYFAQMWEKTGPIMEKRLAGAITGVASTITQAWIDAGKPVLTVDPAPHRPRPIKR
jgi:hypothetical protein